MSGEMKAYLDGYADGCDYQSSPRWTCREQISKMRQRENLAWRTGWKNGFEDKRSKK